MFVFSEQSKTIINIDSTEVIYVGAEGKIRTCDINGKSYVIGTYDNNELAGIALQVLFEKIKNSSSNMVFMPTKCEIELKSRSFEAKERAGNGKKTVRRGGS